MALTRQTIGHHPPHLQRAAAGDMQAFRQLYEDNLHFVAHHTGRLLGPKADLQEAVQEVFRRLYRSLPEYRDDCQLSTWLYRLTRALAFELLQSRNKTIALDDWRPLRASGAAWKRLDSRTRLRGLYAALDQLDCEYRETFILFELEGLKLREIAALTDSPISTTASRVRRSRKQLHTILTPNPRTNTASPGTCQSTRAQLFELRQGQLEPNAQALFDAHLKDCPLCQDHCEKLESMLDLALLWEPANSLFDQDALFARLCKTLHDNDNHITQIKPLPPPHTLALANPLPPKPSKLTPLQAALPALTLLIACLASFHLLTNNAEHPSPASPPTAAKADIASPPTIKEDKPGPLRLRMMAEKALRERDFARAAHHYEELLEILPPRDRAAGLIRFDLARIYRRHLHSPEQSLAHLRYIIHTRPDDTITPQAIIELCRLKEDPGEEPLCRRS